MATEWKSQQGDGMYHLQFETDDKEKYKLVEKAAQMAIDGKTTADVEEVKHGEWELKSETYQFLDDVDEEFYVECPLCNRVYYVPCEVEQFNPFTSMCNITYEVIGNIHDNPELLKVGD